MRYIFRILASTKTNLKEEKSGFFTIPDSTIPLAPTGLKLINATEDSVKIEWDRVNKTIVDDFKIYLIYKNGVNIENRTLNKYKDILKKDSETDVVNFNAGTVYYKTEDYENAVTHFRKSLLGKDETLKTNAYYNLGNSLYKLGLSKEEQDLQSAVALLENSLGEYEKSLKINKEDKTVQSNHAFVRKELERLRKKLQQQQQNKIEGTLPYQALVRQPSRRKRWRAY